jgi:outer membrane protein
MRYKILIFLGVLLFPVAFIANTANAEDIEELNLRSAVELALINNLNLQLRQEDVDSAEGASLAAEGVFDIFIDADAGFQSKEQTPIFVAGPEQEDTGRWNAEASKLFTTGTSVSLGWNNSSFNSDAKGLLLDPNYDSGLTLGLRQPLMRGFGEEVQTALLRSSQKQLEAATYQVDNEAANLAADVKIAYWNLVFAIQDIEVKRLSVTLAQKLLEETETKIFAGRLAEVEIYQPQSEVARREEELIRSERAIGTAEDELKLLLNTDKWATTIDPTDQPASEPITVDLRTVLNNALKSRPDIKAADLLIESAKYEELRAKDDIRPDLALVGGVGLTGTAETYSDSLDNSLSNPDDLWQIGVTFSIPLENRTAKGNYRQAKANHSRAKTSAELLRQQIRRTVRTTVRDVRLVIKAIDATRKTSLASLKALEAEQAKFDSGRSTTLDVLIAQQSYSQALSQQNLTLITYANILAELDRIQGLVTFSSSR